MKQPANSTVDQSTRHSVLKSLIATILVMIQLPAQAAIYGPINFKDGQSHERKDIKSMLKSLRVERSRNPVPALSYVDTSDVRLTMFTELAQVLEALAQPQYLTVTLPEVNLSCAAHETFDLKNLPTVNSSTPPCLAVQAQLAQVLSPGFEKACRYTYQAERFVEDRGRGVVSRAELETLEGLIAVAGEPLSHLQFPANVVSPDFKSKMRSVIAKVRTEKLTADLDHHAADLIQLSQLVAEHASCFSGEKSAQVSGVIGELQFEIARAHNYLNDLNQSGLAQAQADRKLITSRSRNRTTLPFPALTDQERQLLSMYLGGVYWRMRGGGLIDEPQGTQATRVWYHLLPMSMIGYINGGDVGKAAGEAMFFRIFQGWSKWMTMGHSKDGGDKYYDLVYMTDRGDRQIPESSMVLAAENYEPADLRIGALQMGACYYFAYDRLPNFQIGATLKPPYGAFVDGATSWGELCAGAAISLGLSKSLLNGNGY